jgi:hypothetical protein
MKIQVFAVVAKAQRYDVGQAFIRQSQTANLCFAYDGFNFTFVCNLFFFSLQNPPPREAPRGPPPADGASLVFLPLVEDPPQAWTGEDRGGGEDMVMLPPPLTPPAKGGEFKGCRHVGSKLLV